MESEEEVVVSPEGSSETQQPQHKKKGQSTWKYVFNIILVLAISGLAVFLAVRNNFDLIVHHIVTADYRFLLVILGLMCGFVLMRAFMLFCFARLFTRDYKYHQGIAVEFIGTFYSAITPGGQGGEVMQAYTYKKQGIPISSAVSALAMNSIIHQILLIIFGSVSFIVKYDFIMKLPYATLFTFQDGTVISLPMWLLTLLGFGLNVGYITLILAMAYWKKFHNFIMGPIITLLHKIKLVKDPDKSRENWRTQIENFKMEIRRLFSNIPFTILISCCFVVSMSIKFCIPYFVGLAMGNQSTCASFWDAIFLSNYHQMATGLIPVPGSAGISEFVFNSLFSTSPATASTSFFYLKSTGEQQIEAFNYIIHNAAGNAGLKSFFSHVISKGGATISGAYQNAAAIETEAINLLSSGATYETAPEAFRQVCEYYADTKASSSMASAALVLWRFATFIIPLIAAGFVTAFYRASPRKDAEESERMVGRHTLVDLQRDTYFDRSETLVTMVETSHLNRENIAKRLKALSRRDRANKRRRKKEAEEAEAGLPNEYTDVTIDDGDDSL